MRQVFNVSFGAGDGRFNRSLNLQAERSRKSVYFRDRFHSFFLVSHNTATSNFTTTYFELRFDKNDQFSARSK